MCIEIHFKGATDFQCAVSMVNTVWFLMGDSHAWPETSAWNPQVRLSTLWKPNKHISTHAKHVVNNPRVRPIMQTDWFERWDRLPMCSLLWGTAMHWRTPVHGTSCQTHDKQCEGHASAHPDACERRVRLPICGYSWGDSHAWTDNFAWNPNAWLPALLKLNEQMLTYAKHKISNPRGTQSVHIKIYIEGATDFQCAVSHGGQPCMGGHLCNFVFILLLLQINSPVSQWFPPSGKHPEQRILVITANCRLYSNISQILLLYKRGGI